MTTAPIRLQRLLAACGVAPSRRHAERLLSAGRVTLVGGVGAATAPCSLGASLAAADFPRLRLDGKPLPPLPPSSALLGGSPSLFAFHKPRGYLSAWTDTRSPPRGTLTDALTLRGPAPPSPRLLHAGRLDFDSEGLLLLTPDGDLALRITHPSLGCVKRYIAVAIPLRAGAPTPAHRIPAILRAGVALPPLVDDVGERGVSLSRSLSASLSRAANAPPKQMESSHAAAATRAAMLAWEDVFSTFRRCGAEAHVVDDVPLWARERRQGAVAVELELADGRKRVVRRMFAALGWRVERLLRVAVGSVELGALTPGQWAAVDADAFQVR